MSSKHHENSGQARGVCPSDESIFIAFDAKSPNAEQSAHLAHARDCGACREALHSYTALSAAVGMIDTRDEQAAERVRLNVVSQIVQPRPNVRPALQRVRIVRALMGLALAAGMLVGAPFALRAYRQSRAPQLAASEFVARGAGLPKSIRERTGIILYALRDGRAEILTSQSRVTTSTEFVAGYRNIELSPVYLAVCAVDAQSQVHWLYPAYQKESEAPQSLALARADTEALLPSSVRFEDMAKGELRILILRTEHPLSIRELDALPPTSLTLAGLGAHYAGAVVSELKLEVE